MDVVAETVYRGVSFGFMAKCGTYARPDAAEAIDRMAEMNVGAVAVMATVMQDTYASTRMYRDYHFTVSDWELMGIIERIHDAGMKVMLKPILECHDSVWRGCIAFPEGHEQIQGIRTDYWGPWFASLGDALVNYGRLAEAAGVDALCLGCEYKGAERRDADWRGVLQRVREVYTGKLTYNAAGYDSLVQGHLPEWYGDLDLLGLSYYVGAGVEPTVPALVDALRPTVDRLRDLLAALEMPLFFAEAGCRSVVNGHHNPAQYRNAGAYDGDVQANWFDAVWTLFHDQPWWGGMFWWKWDEQQDRPQYHQPGGDTGFTIAGKPAELRMKQRYGAG